MTVAALLGALASSDPTPGGGTAAAIAGAMGTSLLVMVTRSRAIQDGLRAATVVPLETLRACAIAIDHGRAVASHGNRSASSDVGVAIGLLKAAADGAAANVRINLASLKDEVFRTATEDDTTRVWSAATAAASDAMRAVAN
jgi:formiminotetrahydrofolate cyclodeaminase